MAVNAGTLASFSHSAIGQAPTVLDPTATPTATSTPIADDPTEAAEPSEAPAPVVKRPTTTVPSAPQVSKEPEHSTPSSTPKPSPTPTHEPGDDSGSGHGSDD